MNRAETENRVTRRRLGRTAEEVSCLGIGGHHIGIPEDAGVGIEIVRRALDGGLDFLDNSWDYHSGESERRMGLALQDGYRDKAFLMTKIDSRSADGARRQLEESLERLRTDHIDLLQLHEVIREDDADRAFAAGGAIEALAQARDEGLIRFIGFTGHKDPAIHLRMIYTGLAEGFVFDTVQMPVNAMDVHYRSFTQLAMPVCEQHDIGVIGMKALGNGHFPLHKLTAEEYLGWSLSQPVSVLVTGCETLERVEQAIRLATDFKPLDDAQLERIESLTRASGAAQGRFELFKTSTMFDATTYSPQWLA